MYRKNLLKIYSQNCIRLLLNSSMIARKDALTMEINALRNVLKAAAEPEHRYSRGEIKYVRTLDMVRLRKKIDSLSAQLRKTELNIQETNWSVELEEAGRQPDRLMSESGEI